VKKVWVPVVNSSKIISSLTDKFNARRTSEDNFMRLISAYILCFWTEERPVLQKCRADFLATYPYLRSHRINKSDQVIEELYVGHFEAKTSWVSEFLPEMESLYGSQLGGLNLSAE